MKKRSAPILSVVSLILPFLLTANLSLAGQGFVSPPKNCEFYVLINASTHSNLFSDIGNEHRRITTQAEQGVNVSRLVAEEFSAAQSEANFYRLKVIFLAYLEFVLHPELDKSLADVEAEMAFLASLGIRFETLDSLGLRRLSAAFLHVGKIVNLRFEGAVGFGLAQLLYLDPAALEYLQTFEMLHQLNVVIKTTETGEQLSLLVDLTKLGDVLAVANDPLPGAVEFAVSTPTDKDSDLSIVYFTRNLWTLWNQNVIGNDVLDPFTQQPYSLRAKLQALMAAYHPSLDKEMEQRHGHDLGPAPRPKNIVLMSNQLESDLAWRWRYVKALNGEGLVFSPWLSVLPSMQGVAWVPRPKAP